MQEGKRGEETKRVEREEQAGLGERTPSRCAPLYKQST